jgi:hypothetical protein
VSFPLALPQVVYPFEMAPILIKKESMPSLRVA